MKRLAIGVLAAGLLGHASVAQTDWRRIGKAWAKGDFPLVSVNTDAASPKRFRAVVSANPDQKVELDWYVFCSGAGDSSSQSESTTRMTPFIEPVPVTMDGADECDVRVSVNPDISEGVPGRVEVILETKP